GSSGSSSEVGPSEGAPSGARRCAHPGCDLGPRALAGLPRDGATLDLDAISPTSARARKARKAAHGIGARHANELARKAAAPSGVAPVIDATGRVIGHSLAKPS